MVFVLPPSIHLISPEKLKKDRTDFYNIQVDKIKDLVLLKVKILDASIIQAQMPLANGGC